MNYELKPQKQEGIFEQPLVLTGNEVKDKEEFFRKATNEIRILEKDDFYDWLGRNNKYFVGGVTGYFFIRRDPNDVNTILGFDCALNKVMYLINGVDYSDIIPILVTHELNEGWDVASKFLYPKEKSNNAHFEARVAELREVEERGLTEKYFKWIEELGVPKTYLDELNEALKIIENQKTQHNSTTQS